MSRTILVSMVMTFAVAASAQTAAEKCQAGKNEAAGKLAACVGKAQKKFVLNSDAVAYADALSRCTGRFGLKWSKLEQKALDSTSSCPDSVTDTEISSFVDGCKDAIASALAGNPLIADPVSCDGSLTTCNSDYDSCSASLTGCDGNLSSCNGNVATCNAGTAALGDVLAGKTFSSMAGLGATGTATEGANVTGVDGSSTFTIPNGFYSGAKTCTAIDTDLVAGNLKSGKTIFGVTGIIGFPKSAQTTSYGAGSDGAVQAGTALSFTDNGDGTISDNVTGLMWEKKDDSGGIHDKDAGYTWSGPSYGLGTYLMDGTISTTFLMALNAGSGFAGHTDWRIPNIKELQTIVDYEVPYPGPNVNEAFHKTATCTDCADVTAASCSCTVSYYYWSSSTFRGSPNDAWNVLFTHGLVNANLKDNGFRVRAVRGGL